MRWRIFDPGPGRALTKWASSPTAVMIVGALVGVLSLSDYRVDLDASVDVPESTLGRRATRLARLDYRRLQAERQHDLGVPAVACAPAAPRSEPLSPIDSTGVCEPPTPAAVVSATAPMTDAPEPEAVELAAVEPQPELWEQPCDPEGPGLPLGVAIARAIGSFEQGETLHHWPERAVDEQLLVETHGPNIPTDIAQERLVERLEDADAAAKLLAAVDTGDQPAATILAGLEQGWLIVTRSVEAGATAEPAVDRVASLEQADADADSETYRIWEDPDAAVGPEIDEDLLAARKRQSAEQVVVAAWVDPDPDAAVGPEIDDDLLAARKRQSAEQVVVAAWVDSDPDAAVGPEIDEDLLAARKRQSAEQVVVAAWVDPDPDAAVGPEIDEAVLAARKSRRQAASVTLAAARRAGATTAGLFAEEIVGPPLPSFAEICAARFDELIELANAGQTLAPDDWTTVAAADADDETAASGASPNADAGADEISELPFDPLQTGPFDGDPASQTRRAFEEVLEADGELHTVRYVKELTHKLERGETLSEVLQATGLNSAEIDEWVLATQKVYDCNRVYAGQDIKLRLEMPDRVLRRMQLDVGKDAVVIVEDEGASIVARTEDIHFERNLRVASAHIEQSLYVSAVEKSIPERVISEMAEILGWEINFGRDLQPGAEFRVIYEELTRVDTAHTVPGRVLAVDVNNLGEQHEGFYYEATDSGSGAYYDRQGVSLGRTFLRFPVSYSRISSPFTTARYHPVLKRSIPHLGVDFAAPTGTPVKAVADGTVVKSGWYGGNGRFVKLQHDSVYESGYAHLSRISPSVTAGKRVKRGQVIGYVGATGLATGPHLHFALYKGGRYIDPMKAELPRERSLIGSELAAFKMKVAMMDRAYAQAGDGSEIITQVAAVDLPEQEEAR